LVAFTLVDRDLAVGSIHVPLDDGPAQVRQSDDVPVGPSGRSRRAPSFRAGRCPDAGIVARFTGGGPLPLATLTLMDVEVAFECGIGLNPATCVAGSELNPTVDGARVIRP
jgi:hypothetical protein